MSLVARFGPPGNLKDFDTIPGQLDLWHTYIQKHIRSAFDAVGKGLKAEGTETDGTNQFYDPSRDEVGPTIPQDIVWNAFPGELLRRFGRERALQLADTLWPLPAYQLGWRYKPDTDLPDDGKLKEDLDEVPSDRGYLYRPQTEYCEWRVEPAKGQGRVRRVTFTCEPPEYWSAMFGGELDSSAVRFTRSPEALLSLYRNLVSPDVVAADIIAARSTLGKNVTFKGGYNPYNRWNTVDGIAHLVAPPNALIPEILLAAQSTRVYRNARNETVDLAHVLTAGAKLGNCNRNSDLAIVAAVNALARQGRRITLADPIGICIDHIDLSGWEFPGGLTSADCIRHVRGEERATLRLVVEMPKPEFDVSDIRIGGVPIQFGGQIAECITVKLRALASIAGGIRNERDVLSVRSFWALEGGGELFAGPLKSAPESSVPALGHAAVRPPEVGATPPTRNDVGEPLLDLDQIQGIAIPGFLKPQQTLLCVRHGRDKAELSRVKALLSRLLPHITTGHGALDDRRRFRRGAQAPQPPLMAIAFTWPGLCSLTASAASMKSEAFRQGMAARSALLGDPTQADVPGHPSSWVVGGPDNTPDFMIVIAGDHRTQVDLKARSLLKQLRAAGCEVQRQNGGKLEKSGQSREHFGFVDGISQPGIRGRPRKRPSDFVTRSVITDWPASSLQGFPGQDLVWPGEFVLGYARSGPDPLLAGPIAEAELPWMHNGSYLVYNRLLQNVGAFWKTMREEAARLSSQPGFAEIGAHGLAARLVGRTRNGVPVSRLQGPERSFHEGLGSNRFANNHFRFDSDTPRLGLTRGSDAYPSAKADPLGLVCPLASHIRKVNPRDSASDVGGEGGNHQHRILRVGVPFGPRRKSLEADTVADEPERGQLFLCIQSSIEEQFEFLQTRWINDDSRPKSPGGNDMVAGRMPSTSDGMRRCTIFGVEGQQQEVRARECFVTSSGGAYFFVPSIDAIREVLAAQ